MPLFMGIDIGSRTTKGVVLKDGEIAASHLVDSGSDYARAAGELRERLLALAKARAEDVAYTVATGQRVSLPFVDETVDDIRCCARGMFRWLPSVRTIIDIGSQSSQVIRVSERGSVTNFVVSEKCAGGSGRFLDVIANVLRVSIEEVSRLSLESQHPVVFSTGCAVFGESEAISRVAEGISKEDIAAGVHEAVAAKVAALVSRVGMEPGCAVSGGGGLNAGLVRKIEEKLGVRLLVPPQPQLVNALGAAIMAAEKARAGGPANPARR